jgi:hypothetical protein
MATKLDVIRRAFRFLGVVADDEAMTADQEAAGSDLLDSLYAEVSNEAPPSFTIEDVPAESATFLAMVLAADLAPQYSAAPPYSRGQAMIRLLGTIRPDDRPAIVEAEYY